MLGMALSLQSREISKSSLSIVLLSRDERFNSAHPSLHAILHIRNCTFRPISSEHSLDDRAISCNSEGDLHLLL